MAPVTPSQSPQIVLVNAPQPVGTGDYENRAGFAARTLAALGVSTRVVMTHQPHWFETALHAPLAILLMTGSPNVHQLLAERKKNHLPTVVEISDHFMAFQTGNALRAYYSQAWVQDAFLGQMAAADVVQFSSPGLLARFGELASQALLAQNAVEPAMPLAGPADSGPTPEAPWVVGLAFSAGHAEDAARAAPAIFRLVNRRKDVRVELMCDPALFAPFRALGPGVVHQPPMGYRDYQEHLKTWHITVIPSTSDPFNLCRSDGKWLDAARAGAVGVVPRQMPFSLTVRENQTGLFYQDLDELDVILEALLSQPGEWARLRRAAQRHVNEERNWRVEMDRRLSVYETLQPALQRQTAASANESCSQEAESLYGALAVLSGLDTTQNPQPAKDLLVEQTRACPDWAAPWENLALFEGRFPPDDSVLWSTPPNAELWFRWYLQAQMDHLPPELDFWPTAHALQAMNDIRADKPGEAQRHLANALRQNPNSTLALRGAILMALQAGRSVKASHLFQKLARVDGESASQLGEQLGLRLP